MTREQKDLRNTKSRAIHAKRKRYKKWYAAHKKCRSDYWKQWKYGLTPEAYKELFDKQQGKCAIPSCANPIDHIDHDHVTDKVRGLLCQKCNRGLGHFNDNPQLLEEAAAYLEKYSGRVQTSI